MKGYVSKQFNTLLLLAVYLFVVITHIFFVPNHSRASSKAKSTYNSIFKRKIEDGFANKLALLQRTDKTVLNDKKDTNSLILIYAGIFLILFCGSRLFFKSSIYRRFDFLNFSQYKPFIFSLRI
jgi:hypothetical protein